MQRERIYLHDGPMWTSAGVTTGIELALALVEDDLGHAVSMEIARTLALPMLRGGEQPQLSQTLEAQATASQRLRELVGWIGAHLQDDLSVDALAGQVQMSPRHFARAFAAQTGCTPARFVEQVRVAAAAQLLRQTRWTQDRIASRSGFRSVDARFRAAARPHAAFLSRSRAEFLRRVAVRVPRAQARVAGCTVCVCRRRWYRIIAPPIHVTGGLPCKSMNCAT